jgi:ABC-2 type transport system permease protein
MRQMVWIALGLLAFAVGDVVVARLFAAHRAAQHDTRLLGAEMTRQRYGDPWSLAWRWTRRGIPVSHGDYALDLAIRGGALPLSPEAAAIQRAIAAAYEAVIEASPFEVFARNVLFSLFVSFLLPLWSLSFATEAFGGEREHRSLVWLLTRPLPRWAVYLAKYVGMLPWVLGFNVGGFGLICLAAGEPGRLAFRLFWPAVAVSGVAFAALFHLFGAVARRPTIVALGYSFFLETIIGDMPGLLKRVSVTFYTRCIMFDAASAYGVSPEKPGVYQPVSGATAWAVLLSMTAVLLVAGMWWFSRAEYRDET